MPAGLSIGQAAHGIDDPHRLRLTLTWLRWRLDLRPLITMPKAIGSGPEDLPDRVPSEPGFRVGPFVSARRDVVLEPIEEKVDSDHQAPGVSNLADLRDTLHVPRLLEGCSLLPSRNYA